MEARLFRVILPVGSVDRAAAFYAAVLGRPGRRVSGGRHYFDCGGVILACYDPQADGDTQEATPLADYLYLAVSDLEAAYLRVRSTGQAEVESPIERRPWGERSFYIRDPFGNGVCFVDESTIFTGEG